MYLVDVKIVATPRFVMQVLLWPLHEGRIWIRRSTKASNRRDLREELLCSADLEARRTDGTAE